MVSVGFTIVVHERASGFEYHSVFPLFCEEDIVACEIKGNKEPDMNHEK